MGFVFVIYVVCGFTPIVPVGCWGGFGDCFVVGRLPCCLRFGVGRYVGFNSVVHSKLLCLVCFSFVDLI